jgi:hypothetical protein
VQNSGHKCHGHLSSKVRRIKPSSCGSSAKTFRLFGVTRTQCAALLSSLTSDLRHAPTTGVSHTKNPRVHTVNCASVRYASGPWVEITSIRCQAIHPSCIACLSCRMVTLFRAVRTVLSVFGKASHPFLQPTVKYHSN